MTSAVEEHEASIKPEDETSPVSTHKRSCLRLNTVEPCVNKAVFHLEALRQRLLEQERAPKPTSLQKKRQESPKVAKELRSATPKPPLESTAPDRLDINPKVSVLFDSSELFVRGTRTGNERERRRGRVGGLHEVPWLDAEDVILEAVDLVARLEQDRQEALSLLASEKVRVCQLRDTLDVEAEKRLNLLPTVVQQEHEECIKDILELKWHVSYEGRQLTRIKDNLRIAAERNGGLLKEVTYLTEHSPLLQEKLVLENDNISQITQQQQEEYDHLNQAKHKLMQTEDKSHQAHSRADAERLQMERALNEIKDKLRVTSNQLSAAAGELTAISHKMNNAHRIITEHRKQSRLHDEKRGQGKIKQSVIESRVSYLRDDHCRMKVEHQKVEERNASLREKMESQHKNLESRHLQLLAVLQTEERTLRETRDRNEDMEQEIDTIREKIATCLKKTEDNVKSVERAKKELVRLDQQLQVSMSQYSKVREENFRLTQQFQTEKVETGNIEHTLKSTIETLQQQLKEETTTKTILQGKFKAESENFDRLMVEGGKKKEMVQKMAWENEKQKKGQTDMVSRLERSYAEKQQLHKSLQFQTDELKEQHSSAERELGEKRKVLWIKEQQLRAGVQEKVAVVDEISEKIKLLERRLEDIVKSSTMVLKMERDTTAAIERIESEVDALKEKVAEEKREEQSWREEFSDISEFSTDADERHTKYLQEREALVQQYEVDLQEALSANTSLSRRYHELQSKFIEVKTLALSVLERKLDIEKSLRDHKQLLAFQSRMYTTMKNYYQHRGITCSQNLQEFCKDSSSNMQQLKTLQSQFDTVIRLMQEFLEHGLHRDRRSKAHKARDKSVTFSVPVACKT